MNALLPIPARMVAHAWELLATAARDAFGDRPICEGCEGLSYDALCREAGRVAGLFVRDGIAPGARVAVLVPLGKAWLAAAFGAWRAGLVVCAEVAPGASEPRVDAAVVDAAALARLLTSGAAMPARIYVTASVGPVPPGLLDFDAGAPPAPARPVEPTAVAFARGGLTATHAQLLVQLAGLQERLRLRAPARVLAPASALHESWPVATLLLPLAAGATIVFADGQPGQPGQPDLARAELIRTQSISHAFVDLPVLVALALASAPQAGARPSGGTASEALGGALAGLGDLLAARFTPDHVLSRAVAGLQDRLAQARTSALQALVTTSTDPRLGELMALGLPILRAWAPAGALGYATMQDGLPPRADSVGRPLRGVEVTVGAPDAAGIGELVLSGPALGFPLATGMRGRVDASLHVLLAPASPAPSGPLASSP